MAFWIDRKKAAEARHFPKPTTKHEIDCARVGMQDEDELLEGLPGLMDVPKSSKKGGAKEREIGTNEPKKSNTPKTQPVTTLKEVKS